MPILGAAALVGTAGYMGYQAVQEAREARAGAKAPGVAPEEAYRLRMKDLEAKRSSLMWVARRLGPESVRPGVPLEQSWAERSV